MQYSTLGPTTVWRKSSFHFHNVRNFLPNTPRSATCQKCQGPATPLDSGRTMWGIQKHIFDEMRAVPAWNNGTPSLRNTKREEAAKTVPQRPTAKGYGKVWSEADIDLMLQLEIQMRGHPRITKQMEPHFPGKTGKQIRDKRKAPYKRMLQSLLEAAKAGATPYRNPEPNEDRAYHISKDLVIATPLTQEKKVPLSDPSESLDTVGENTENIRREPPYWRPENHRSNTYCEWVQRTIDQVLENTPSHNAPEGYQDLYSCSTNILKKKRNSMEIPSQDLINELYTHLNSMFMEIPHERTASRPKHREKSRKTSRRQKRRHIYATIQDLYKNNPGALARYIREGVPWLEDQGIRVPKEAIKYSYAELWGVTSRKNM